MRRNYPINRSALFGLMGLLATSLPAGPIAQEYLDLSALTVVDAEGAETPLAERMPDGPAIVHFWATWCIPCREELPQVGAFQHTLEGAGMSDRLVVVSVDKRAFSEVAAFLKNDLGIGLETLLVTTGNPGATLGLFGYPYTLLLDKDGAIIQRFPGPIDWTDPARSDDLRAHLMTNP